MPLSLGWPKSLKIAADNADNTEINCVDRSDVVLVGGR